MKLDAKAKRHIRNNKAEIRRTLRAVEADIKSALIDIDRLSCDFLRASMMDDAPGVCAQTEDLQNAILTAYQLVIGLHNCWVFVDEAEHSYIQLVKTQIETSPSEKTCTGQP